MRILLLSLLLASCADFTYRSPGDYTGGSIIGPGSYLAEAVFTAKGGDPQRFNLLFSRKPVRGFALLTGLAGSGKTIFRARDTLSARENPVLEFFPTEAALSHEQLTAFYEGLRPLFLLSDDPKRPATLVLSRHADGRPASLAMPGGPTLTLKEYDWEGHAFRVTLEGGGWEAEVTLREYQI
jgi:hypothetical protein